MKHLAALLVLLALTGCSRTFYKPDGTQAEWAQIKYRCAHENSQQNMNLVYNPMLGSYQTVNGTQIDSNMMAACLNAQGWYER